MAVAQLPSLSFVKQNRTRFAKTGGKTTAVAVVVSSKRHRGITFTLRLVQAFGQISIERGPYTIPAMSSGTQVRIWRKKRHRRGSDAAILVLTGAVGAKIVPPTEYIVIFRNPGLTMPLASPIDVEPFPEDE
jgi:hypothetical protein